VLEVCARNRPIAALLALCFCQFVAEGASDVVVVVLAIDVLHLGSGAAGYLNAMFGAGAVLGGAGAVLLINRRPLSTPLLCAAASWGLAFLGLAVCHTAAAAFVSLAVAGAARTVLGTSARTMLHRVAPPAVHGRLFGSLEGIAMAGLAVGSLTVPVLAGIGGLGAALIGSGGLLLVVTLSVVVALRRLDTYGIAPTSRPAGGELIAGALATALSPAVR
jgi:hypothetical protein